MGDIDNKKYKIWIKLMNFGHRLGCHQMYERSFSFKGYQFPLCARCTGVLVGEILAIVFIIFKLILPPEVIPFLLVIMGIDWFIQKIGLLESTNIRRFLTGICGGIGLTYIYYYIIVFIIFSLMYLKKIK